MISSGVLATYVAVALGLMVIPGPATLLTLAKSISGGRRAGMATGLGIALGDLVHTAMATFGLSTLLAASALAFEIVKYAGVLYLIYLGLKAFAEKGDSLDLPAVQASRPAKAFRQGLFTELLNPKTALFFLAFLPQFIDPSASFPVWVQFLILGTCANLIFSSADIVCVLLAGVIVTRLKRSSGAQRLMRRAGGALLVGLGAHLALQRT